MKRVYLDYAATTPLDSEVLEEMFPYYSEIFGNASSQHWYGQKALNAVDRARERVAAAIGAKPNEIYFTSGGTESDNWAIKGAALANAAKGRHVISTAIEHHAVLNSLEELTRQGFEVTYLPVNGEGVLELETLKKALRADTVLISVMTANNEIGSVQPIAEIGAFAAENGVLFHTDAVQAVGSIPVSVSNLNVDLLSLSAHKFYGPKGVGALYVKSGVRLDKLIVGGSQERSMRGGTYNVAGIVGLGAAIEKAVANLSDNSRKTAETRDYFVSRVKAEIPSAIYNGVDSSKRLPGNANFTFPDVEGEGLLMALDLAGVAVSAGSACSAGTVKASHVILALGMDEYLAQGSIRFSFGKNSTKEDADYTIEKLKFALDKLQRAGLLFKQNPKDVYSV